KGAALNGGNPVGLIAAAQLLLKAGRLDDAQRDAERAVELASSDYAASLGAAEKLLALVALGRKNFDEARAHAASAQDAEPSTPHVEFVDGLIAFVDAHFDEALAHFRKAEAESDRTSVHVPELHFNLAQTLEVLDRWSEAVEHLEREVELFPRNLRARASLA